MIYFLRDRNGIAKFGCLSVRPLAFVVVVFWRKASIVVLVLVDLLVVGLFGVDYSLCGGDDK